MTKEKIFDDTLNSFEKIVKKNMATSELLPVLNVIGKKGNKYSHAMIVIASLPEGEEKYKLVFEIGSQCNDKKFRSAMGEVKYVIFASESWVSIGSVKKGWNGVMPSKDPKRKEALILTCKDLEKNRDRLYVHFFERKDGKVKWGDESDTKWTNNDKGTENFLLNQFVKGYILGNDNSK